MCVCVCVCEHSVFICKCERMHVCLNVWACVYLYVCVCGCVDVCMFMCVQVCVIQFDPSNYSAQKQQGQALRTLHVCKFKGTGIKDVPPVGWCLAPSAEYFCVWRLHAQSSMLNVFTSCKCVKGWPGVLIKHNGPVLDVRGYDVVVADLLAQERKNWKEQEKQEQL